VTDHTVFGYFVEEYGFTQIGAVIPAQTTEAETSGQQLAYLIDIIREEEVKAIFIGVDFDPTLSQMVAKDTGVDLIPLYFGSLSAGAPAGTYLTFMRHNVKTIVNALR
jgi:ABC-type Zn uptake system ZnuABC Zn-binding protein ZnuA